MTSVGLYEAKTHLSALARRVAAGEEIIVTDRGRPVMKLVAVTEIRKPDAEDFTQKIEKLRQQGIAWRKAEGQPPLTVEETLSWLREGRR